MLPRAHVAERTKERKQVTVPPGGGFADKETRVREISITLRVNSCLGASLAPS